MIGLHRGEGYVWGVIIPIPVIPIKIWGYQKVSMSLLLLYNLLIIK